jgi:hypothetical protein
MDRSSLEDLITWDKSAIAAASLVVAFGLVGEYWKEIRKLWLLYWDMYPIEFRPLLCSIARESRKTLLFPILVIVGVSAEWLYESDSSVREAAYAKLLDEDNSRHTDAERAAIDRAAAAGKEAAASNERARALEKDAEELRSENLAIEKEVAQRRINPDECASYIPESLKKSPRLIVRVSSYSSDGEGGILSWQIAACLVRAKIDADWEPGSISTTGGFGFGLFVSGKDESLVYAIKAALERSNVEVMDGTGVIPPNQITLRPSASPNPAASVVVGIKPPIDMK